MSKLVAKNAIILVFTEILCKLIEFVCVLALARILGVEKYGLFVFLFTMGTFFSLIQHFGFDYMVVRDISRDKDKTGQYLVGIILVKGLLFLLAFGLLVGWLKLFSDFNESNTIILYACTVSSFFLTNILFTSAFFRAHQKAYIEAIIRFFLAIAITGGSIAAALISGSLLDIFIARIVICFLFFAISLFFILKILKPVFKGCFDNIFQYIKKGWPFAASVFFAIIYISIDIVMIKVMVGDKATGLYSIASKILAFFTLVSTGICGAVLPALSEKIKSEYSEFIKFFYKIFRYLLIIAIFFILFNSMLSEEIILLLFGIEYQESGKILFILSWTLVPQYMNQLFGNLLLSTDKEKLVVFFMVFGAVFNILINLFLIPKYGCYGAAVATILTESVVVFSQFIYLKKDIIKTGKDIFQNVIFLIGSIIFILGAEYLFKNYHISGFIVCMIIYISILFKLRYVDWQELFSLAGSFLKSK